MLTAKSIDLLRRKSGLTTLFFGLLLVAIGSIVFYYRFPYAFTVPNFHAEDGTVFVRIIHQKGVFLAPFTRFNGYLVAGQYLLMEFAQGINSILGHGLSTLPKAIAVTSYVFLGVITALPFVLFRRRLGFILSVLTCMLLWLVPLGGWDYTTIGTIANMKFAFLYIATMLVIYRNDIHLSDRRWKLFLTDVTLLLCVLTNVVVVAIIPFALFRYKKQITKSLKNRKLIRLEPEQITLLMLLFLSGVYVVIVIAKGIPKIQGYLEGPIAFGSLINVFYRSSIYGLTFPVNTGFSTEAAWLIIVLFVSLVIFRAKNKLIYLTILFAIAINVISFVINRPGVVSLFRTFTTDGGPGHFFYAGTLLFVFGVMYSLRGWYSGLRFFDKAVFGGFVILFGIIAFPSAGYRVISFEGIDAKRPSIYQETSRVCPTRIDPVEIGIYPSNTWTMTVNRAELCTK